MERIRDMGKFAVISIALLFFTGCGLARPSGLYKVQTTTGEKYLPIDEALAYVNNEDDLEKLDGQWRARESFLRVPHYFGDIEKIDRKRQELQNREYQQSHQGVWAAERNAERKRQEVEREQRQAECERLKKEWTEFIQRCDGSLKNKTTQEVKKLVDQWKYYNFSLPCEDAKENEIFSLENFHKVFGKPLKTQFTKRPERSFLGYYLADTYILWYTCRDGNVLITVDASTFDKGWVRISDLDIL